MKVKKVLGFGIAFSLLAAGATTLAMSSQQSVKEAKADVLSAEHYIEANASNFYSGEYNMDNQISQGYETFFDPNRFFGTTHPFINTLNSNGRNMHEGATGDIRSHDFNQTGEYVSFLIGGNPHATGGDNFVNLWQAEEGYNIVSGIGNDAFSDPNISCNMIFKYIQVPADARGRCLIYIHDGTTGNFGGVTFGELRINQTWDDVVESFSAHIATYKLSCNNQANIDAYNAVKNFYDTNAYYADLRTALAAKTSADDNFEKANGLTNWAYDRCGSTAPNGDLVTVNFNNIISNAVAKVDGWFEVPMPFNQTGSYFLNADSSGVAEDCKYRFVSSEFTLSGVGLISAKLGGGTAVLQLLDSNFNVLKSTSTNASGENPILNPGFYDTGVREDSFNIVVNNMRLNTMSRTYLDCAEYKNTRVRVAISDDRTGGNWGLAYFDDVVTYYESLPSFRLDKISQTQNETTYHGIVKDQYVGPTGENRTTFGKAYDFVNSFYNTMRNPSNAVSFCTVSESSEVQALLTEYNGMATSAPAVKAIVDASQDYTYGKNVTSANWYLSEVDTTTYTIASTMTYLNGGGPAPTPAFGPINNSKLFGLNTTESTAMIALISSVVVMALALTIYLAYTKRRKSHR